MSARRGRGTADRDLYAAASRDTSRAALWSGASRCTFVALTLAATIAACGRPVPLPLPGANSLGEAPRTASPSLLTTGSPEPSASPSYPLSGRVVRLVPGGMVLDAAGRQIEVSFSGIVDVWRETSVATSEIEVGDSVFINNGHVPANIGRVDGVIRGSTRRACSSR